MIGLLFAVGAAFAGVVPASSSPEVQAALLPRRVAVVVGVQDYADPSLRGLRFTAKDAQDVGAALQDPNVGDFDRVIVLTGAATTTRGALRHAIENATADLQRDDTFVLYLSGHGTLTIDPAEGSRLWFLPSDARLDAPEQTGLAVSELEDIVSALPARRRVLILDTCHNGRAGSKSSVSAATAQVLGGLRGEPPAPRSDRDISESEARLYAAQYYQPAMEDPELGNGVYTHFLLEGLTSAKGEADLDRDGLVDVAEAHEYARDHTIAYTGGLQIPRAEYRIVGREDIFLSGKPSDRTAAERALVTACDSLLARARLLVNGVPRGELPGAYAVEPGSQDIEIQTVDGRSLVHQRVRFEAGEQVPVETLLTRRQGRVSVTAGAAVLAGTDALHAVAPSVGISVSRPLGSLWRPDVHVAFDLATGELPAEPGHVVNSGEVRIGGTFAAQAGGVWIGPSLDLRLPFRTRTDTGEAQAEFTGAAGLSAGGDLPVGRSFALTTRLDAWAGPQWWAGLPEPVYGAALEFGVSALR